MNRNIEIGNIKLSNNVVLAPMAGITDITFRTIVKRFGAGLMYTEMVSAKGLYYRDVKTEQLMKVNQNNRPIALQIFGSDPDIMAYVVENIINQRQDIDIIDINMGCPAPKIVKNNDGSALMREPKLAGEIMNKVKKVSNKPVTAKIRAGWDQSNLNAPEMAKILEYNGADAIAVHGRTRDQYYSGKVDYNIIKEVKNSIKIPVVGNGDIFTPKDAIVMRQQTNCDAVMIGRGILGNPWLMLNTIKMMNEEQNLYEVKIEDRIQMLREHTVMLMDELNEKTAILEMRKQAGWYIKGLKNSSEIRSKINMVTRSDELFDILDKYIKNYGQL